MVFSNAYEVIREHCYVTIPLTIVGLFAASCMALSSLDVGCYPEANKRRIVKQRLEKFCSAYFPNEKKQLCIEGLCKSYGTENNVLNLKKRDSCKTTQYKAVLETLEIRTLGPPPYNCVGNYQERTHTVFIDNGPNGTLDKVIETVSVGAICPTDYYQDECFWTSFGIVKTSTVTERKKLQPYQKKFREHMKNIKTVASEGVTSKRRDIPNPQNNYFFGRQHPALFRCHRHQHR